MTLDPDARSGELERGSHRRQFLQTLGVASVGLLAGCLGDSEETTNSTETRADTPADSTDTPVTPTPAATATPAAASADRPVTGVADAGLSALDDVMLGYMSDLDIDAGALGVAKDGDIVVERGYGWADPDRTEPLAPDALFRIASISKAITDAAVVTLANEGRVSGDDAVYPMLSVDPPGGDPADERFRDVTVRHLLEHTGGWDAQQLGFNPMYAAVRVATHLGLDDPPTKYDTTRFMLDQPMQFDPGSREVYSNFGYSLLGQAIESVTGMGFDEYVQSELLAPAGVEDIQLGYTRPEDRPPREVWYDDDETCPNAFTLEESETATCADAGFLVSAFDAAGGYIASTSGLLRYLQSYWLFGEQRDDREAEYTLFGSHPGSFALARHYPDGVDVVALFNRRQLPLDRSRDIEPRLADAVADVEQWS